jgi:WD40 repeat protein/serine/threonine protein kinase
MQIKQTDKQARLNLSGQIIKGYELRELVKQGDVNVIYRAYQSSLNRDVTLKIILPPHASRPDFIRRFEIEAQLIARLAHPFIVPLYDYWREPDGAYLVMRWLKGGSLRDTLTKGAMALEEVMRVIDYIGQALTDSHQQGVVHRDLKPSNILLDENGHAYLADFSIAKDIERDDHDNGKPSITRPSAYLSPEQIRRETVTPQTDVYSFGIVIYEMLTGHHPFNTADHTGLLLKHLETPLPSIQHYCPNLPSIIDTILQRATAKTSDERFSSAVELSTVLRHALRGSLDDANGTAKISTQPMIPFQPAHNPYKGLRAFQETDVSDFFGRDSLIERLLQQLTNQKTQFLAIVGPSGSGKSSVAKAGLIPCLRQGAITQSERWFVAEMLPSKNPMHDLATALLGVAVTSPDNLLEQLKEDEHGLHKIIDQILPDDDTELVLLIDQFEEVFTLVDNHQDRVHFLNSITNAVTTAFSRLWVIITLRADFYDRPLLYPRFSELVRQHTEVVVPLTVEELGEVIISPAEQVGIQVDAGLVAAIIADVNEQPGALPLLQYTLTELFEQREQNILTLEAYHASDGVLGALANRAEEIYNSFGTTQQRFTRQTFLRLVTLGEGTEDTRRRVERNELLATEIDNLALQNILDTFGQHRLLTFDHDPSTRVPTVEIAHEALISGWGRLRTWINASRDDLRLHRRLTTISTEWANANNDASFLATGARLEQVESWLASTEIILNQQEMRFITASIAQRQQQKQDAAIRQAREEILERRSRVRLYALVFFMFIAAIGAFILTGWALRERTTAEENANMSATAAAAFERSAAEGRSLALTTAARQAIRDDNPDLAIALALEANRIDQPHSQAQQVLAEAVYSTGTRSRRLIPATDHAIFSSAYSGDGRTLLVAYDDRVVRHWDMETGQLLHTFTNLDSLVYSLAYRDGDRIAMAGTGSGKIIVWDLLAKVATFELDAHASTVTAVAYSDNGRLAASGSRDGDIIIWNADNWTQIAVFDHGHSGEISDLSFSDDDRLLASGSLDNTVRVWDIFDKDSDPLLFSAHHDDVLTVDFDPTGQYLLSGSGDNDQSIVIYNLETNSVHKRLEPNLGAINDAEFSGDGRTIIAATANNIVVQWDVATGDELRRLIGHSEAVEQVSFLSDDRQALSLSADHSMRLWDIESGAQLKRLIGHGADVSDVAFSPDGTQAISSSNDRSLILWDIETGEESLSFPSSRLSDDIHSEWILCVAFSPLGDTVVSGSLAHTLILWDVYTGEPIRSFSGHTREILDVAYSSDGKMIVSGAADNMIILWDTETGDEIRRFTGHAAQVRSVMFGSDDSMIVSASADGTLRIWDVETGTMIQVFDGHQEPVSAVAFSPDNATIISGSADRTLRLWDVETGNEIRRFIGHDDEVTGVAFSPTGQTVLSASKDGSLRLWDVSTGDEIARFNGHTDEVTSVTFSVDGRTALSASRDDSIRLWRTFDSLNEMREWTQENRYVRELTCEEREKYLVAPQCD